MAAAEGKPAPSPGQPDFILAAIDRTREAAKWLITTFAAVGAVLIAGSQLSDLGSAEGTRLALAFLGAVLGLGGIAVAIWATSRILAPLEVKLDEITDDSDVGKRAAGDPGILKGQAESVSGLISAYRTRLSAYVTAREATQAAGATTTQTERAKAAEAAFKAVENPMELVRRLALYYKFNSAYKRTLTQVGAGVLAAAIGLVLFAYGANPPEDDGDDPSATVVASGPFITPVPVSLQPTEDGEQALRGLLAENCNTDEAGFILLSSSAERLELLSLPTQSCPSARFSIPADQVSLRPATRAELPAQPTDPSN